MYRLLPILLFALSFSITTDDIYDNSWALIVGISDYEYVQDLNYAVEDALAIKNLKKGFEFTGSHFYSDLLPD